MNRNNSFYLLVFFALSILLMTSLVGAYPAEVPRTGQIISYAADDDGAIQAGAVWPDPRFSERTDGTVSDNLTGLVWAKNANLLGTVDADNDTDGTSGDGVVTWQHALDYIKRLNRLNYLGHSDWRLPNVNELASLVPAGVYNPALPTNPFLNVQLSIYWSSTSHAYYTDGARVVDMDDIGVGSAGKAANRYVWAVRSGQCGAFDHSSICLPKTGQTSCYNTVGDTITCANTGQDGDLQKGVDWPDPRFTVNGDAVTDNLTGLVWTKNANLMVTRDPTFDADSTANDGRVTWQHALDYVAKLNNENYLSHADWRLPNRKELSSLADYSKYGPVLPTVNPFANVQSGLYWSSTSYSGYTDYAWLVGMDGGGDDYDYKTSGRYVWPVRSGQVGNPLITTTTTTVGSTTTVPTTTTVVSTTTSIISSTTTTTGGGTTPSGLIYTESGGSITITGYTCTDGALVIPDTIDGKPVVAIGDNAFKDCTGLTSVTIPASITTIGDSAFNGCSGLTTVLFKGNAPAMGSTVFDGCASGFIIKYSAKATGFTNPWHGYPTTVIKKCPAQQMLGTDNPKLENLRNFRDSKLAQSVIGRKVIQIYYNNADSINDVLENNPVLQATARRVIEFIAPMVGRKE